MAISFDSAANSGYQAASGSYTWAHTCSGVNRILIVSIALLNVANDVSALTYAGVAMTRLRSDVDGTGTIRTDIYYLLAPATGSNTISITLNQASVSAGMSSSYKGVSQYTPVDAQNGTTGTTGAGGGSASISTTVVTEGAWLIDAVATTDTSITVGAGQNQRSNVTGAVGSGGQSDRSALAAGAQTMQWDAIGALLNWTMSTIAILPATIQGTTTSTSSTSASSISTSSTSSSLSTSSTSFSSTSTSASTSSTSTSISSTSSSISSTSSSTSSTSLSSTSSSTSISSTSSSISSTSQSSTSRSTTSSSTSFSSTSSSFSSTSSSQSSTSASTSSTSFSSTSSSSSTSSTTLPPQFLTYSYQDSTDLIQTQTFNATGSWTAPEDVISVTVEVWGGGGGGGGKTTSGGAGGGGGGYSRKAVTVIPGTSYTATVGTGGAGTTGATGGNGNDSWFSTSGTVLAKGGTGGTLNNGAVGVGGAAGSGIGDVTKSGGNGGTGSATAGGAGGGAGGSLVDGSPGTNGGAGTISGGVGGQIGGGRGGDANGTVGAGSPGVTPGGGGGGTGDGANPAGTGAGGRVLLTWTSPGLVIDNDNLLNSFTNAQYSDAAGDDEDYFIEYGSEYMIRQYKRQNANNTDTPQFTWRGRSTESTVTSPILIQIYNVSSGAWETLAVANKVPADTDFSVTVSQTTNISNYYDSTNTVTFRSYQQVI